MMAGIGTAHLREAGDSVLRVEDLVVEFPAKGGRTVHAVSEVSLDLFDGETLGIVGESGCGKSSAGRAIMQLPAPTAGSVRLDDRELTEVTGNDLRDYRSQMQIIFQDPVSSLNPRRKVKDLVAEGPYIQGRKVSEKQLRDVLYSVGLDADAVWERRPHQLSGGQCQRVSIARALMLNPRVLICDEPVSSLDVSVQAQILNLLEETKTDYQLSMIFIAHDLSVVKNISDRIMVLYLGRVCEVLPAGRLVEDAAHPYTQLLLESVPQAGPSGTMDGEVARGGDGHGTEPVVTELPSPLDPPSGCRFRTRCPWATERCAAEVPELRAAGSGHFVACHHADI